MLNQSIKFGTNKILNIPLDTNLTSYQRRL